MRRFLMTAGLRWVVFMVIYWTTFFVVGSPWEFFVLAVYMGFVVGDCVGYRKGLKEGGDIVYKVWGLDTQEGRERVIRQKSRWN